MDLPFPRPPRRPFSRALDGSRSALALGCACLLVAVCPGHAAPAAPASEKTPAPLLADDGFTRESLLEFDAPPEPPPLQTVAVSSADEADSGPAVVHRHHHRRAHPAVAAEEHPTDVVVKASHRRNPLESVVYWWNGFVIRNFHTRNGTVLLRTIGAKT